MYEISVAKDNLNQSDKRLIKLFHLICNRSVLVTVGLGQILSVLICGTAVTSGLLQKVGVDIPTAQSFLNYALLCVVFTTRLAWQTARHGQCCQLTDLKQRLLLYLLVSAVDVEANYLVVKAYHFTTVTSVQLLDCLSIPTVLFLSLCLLGVRYRVPHYTGVTLCLVGIGSLILADVLVAQNSSQQAEQASHQLLGDVLCLAGAVLYGVSNVCQEYLVCRYGSLEYLGAVGLFGSLISGIQLSVMERNELANLNLESASVVLPLVGFSLCLFLLYTLMPVVIAKTGAMAVNLNLLSSDFYALLLGLFVFHYKFHFLYFGAFGLIIIGIVVYTVHPPKCVVTHGSCHITTTTTTTTPTTTTTTSMCMMSTASLRGSQLNFIAVSDNVSYQNSLTVDNRQTELTVCAGSSVPTHSAGPRLTASIESIGRGANNDTCSGAGATTEHFPLTRHKTTEPTSSDDIVTTF